MYLTAEHEAIRISFEEGLSVEQISEQRGLDVIAVKAALQQCSRQYREECKLDEQLDFNDEDLKNANEVIRKTALYSEDPNLAFKAATYIRDDKKGRKEVKTFVQQNTFNLLDFNRNLEAMRDKASKIKSVIDISQAQPA